MAGGESAGFIQSSIEWAALGVEVLAVVVIVAGVVKVVIGAGPSATSFNSASRGRTKATSTNWVSRCCSDSICCLPAT